MTLSSSNCFFLFVLKPNNLSIAFVAVLSLWILQCSKSAKTPTLFNPNNHFHFACTCKAKHSILVPVWSYLALILAKFRQADNMTLFFCLIAKMCVAVLAHYPSNLPSCPKITLSLIFHFSFCFSLHYMWTHLSDYLSQKSRSHPWQHCLPYLTTLIYQEVDSIQVDISMYFFSTLTPGKATIVFCNHYNRVLTHRSASNLASCQSILCSAASVNWKCKFAHYSVLIKTLQ